MAYEHQLTMAVGDPSGKLLWEANARWSTPTPDIRTGLEDAIKLLASHLPEIDNVEVDVPEVKRSHVAIAYWLECNGKDFSAPGLPYTIRFKPKLQPPTFTKPKDPADREEPTLPTGVHDGRALYAYIDLIEHAEIALPMPVGTVSEASPLDPNYWTRVRLGGRYRIGPQAEPVRILVTLTGNKLTGSYEVTNAHIATGVEYEQYLKDLAGWRLTLSKYYDVTMH